MTKSHVAMELCLARINDICPDYKSENIAVDLGKKIAQLYNSIYHNIECEDN